MVTIIVFSGIHKKIELIKLNERKKIREKELELILNEIKLYADTSILEVGCGMGFQASVFQKISESFTSADVTYERLSHSGIRLKNFVKCSGEYLPFKGGVFDIVYMSQVLEHIKNRRRAIKEAKRVLNDRGGILTISAPTSFWKVLDVLKYYITLFCFYLPKFISSNYRRYISLKISTPTVNVSHVECKGGLRKLGTYLLPKPHGEYRNNLEEFIAYRESSWIHLIEIPGFRFLKIKYLSTHRPKLFILIPYFSNERLGVYSSFTMLFEKIRA